MKNIKVITITIIILLALILRVWQLDKYPAGFNADEAAIGYNAYSILQTGKDEYGVSWPLSFKSFGDYKPGLFVYIVMPFVATLGLNEWVVRLPSALLGVGTVILIFLLAKEIFKNEWVGIFASLLLAISPWHLHFSRGGFETNVATFFISLGILLLLKSFKKSLFLFWSMISFLTSMYVYQSPRLIVPIFLTILAFLYRSKVIFILSNIRVRLNRKSFLFIILVILTIPIGLQFISGEGSARFSGLSFLADSGPLSRVNELRGEHHDLNGPLAKVIHNKLTAYGSAFWGHYLDHFRSDFLFIQGDEVIRNKVPETGEFYLIESIFLAIGLVALAKNKLTHTKLLMTWILVAPLASSLTFQTPSALRSLNMVVPLTLVMGYGLFVLGNWAKRFGTVTIIIFITIILSFEFIHYLEIYYIHYPKRYPLAWEYGFSEMVSKLNRYESLYKKIVITDRYDQPYILVLFYKAYESSKYQPQAKLTERDKFNFGTVRKFDNFEFRSIKPSEVTSGGETLFIGTDQEIPENATILDKVNFPNGEPAFVFATKGNL